MTDFTHMIVFIERIDQLLRTEAYLDAKRELEQALAEEPGFGKAHGYLGWLYAEVFRDLKLAELHFEYSIGFDPKFIGAYVNYVALLIPQRRAEKVIEILTAYLDVPEADLEWAFESLGRAHEMKCSYRMAGSHYKKAQHLAVETWKADGIAKDLRRVRKKRWRSFWTSE